MYQFLKDNINELTWAILEANIGIIIITLPSFYKTLLKIKSINTEDTEDDSTDYYMNIENRKLHVKESTY